VGLIAVIVPTAELSRLRFVARWRSDPGAARWMSCSRRSGPSFEGWNPPAVLGTVGFYLCHLNGK
jgi:hypothetical protein